MNIYYLLAVIAAIAFAADAVILALNFNEVFSSFLGMGG